jgi:hypothetical protein
MEKAGMKCFVPHAFNTDQFGTFSGEVKRSEDALSAARKKCELASKFYGFDLVLASEGSFGPHPEFIFVYANEEILVLKDFKNNIEIVSKHLSLDTNFSGTYCQTLSELKLFAEQAKFPSHGLILRDHADSVNYLFKGLRSWDKLLAAFNYVKSRFGIVYVETEMRGMHNPSRQRVIEQTTIKLKDKISSLCPICYYPGFDITDLIHGLPCGNCGLPTRSPKAFLKKCIKCNYTLQMPQNNKTSEDPMFCDYCNP